MRHETLPALLVPAGVARAGVALPALRTEMASGMTLIGGGESFIHNPKKFRTGRDPRAIRPRNFGPGGGLARQKGDPNE